MDLNAIYCGNSVDVLATFPDACIDCVITSPPYDSLRTYGTTIDGKRVAQRTYTFPFEAMAHQLTRVLKTGGVIVWVVGPETRNGSESLAPFKQAIYFVESCGLNLHDTMIYEKNSSAYPAKPDGVRYTQCWEYMYIFSKGRPKTIHLIRDKKNRWEGWKGFGQTTQRTVEGDLIPYERKTGVPPFSPRYNIWRFATGKGYTSSFPDSSEHPACFPESLVIDNLLTWTDEGDVVLDPMNGSGTTTAVAKAMHRRFIGIDISRDYCELAKRRLEFPIDLEFRIKRSMEINNSRYPSDSHKKESAASTEVAVP